VLVSKAVFADSSFGNCHMVYRTSLECVGQRDLVKYSSKLPLLTGDVATLCVVYHALRAQQPILSRLNAQYSCIQGIS